MPEETKDTHSATDVLFEWREASRPFKKRDKSFFINVAALAFLIIVILFFMREFLIIATALSVVFVAYALVAVPPQIIPYKITEKGIWVDDVFYRYAEMSEYWFETHLESTIVSILLPQRRVGRMLLVIPPDKKDVINDLLRKRLVYREKPLKSSVDKMADWLKNKVPLEEQGEPQTSTHKV